MTLVEVVQSALTDDLRRKPWKGDPNPLAGHCYVASEALFHLLGGMNSDWRPEFIRHEGSPHWYLRNSVTNRILDVTASQFKRPVPYSKGTGKGFLTKGPSKRARIVMERCRRDQCQPSCSPFSFSS